MEFTTISYWANRDDIKNYAGEEIDKPHHLARDAEYLLELPEFVRNCDLKANEWNMNESSYRIEPIGFIRSRLERLEAA